MNPKMLSSACLSIKRKIDERVESSTRGLNECVCALHRVEAVRRLEASERARELDADLCLDLVLTVCRHYCRSCDRCAGCVVVSSFSHRRRRRPSPPPPSCPVCSVLVTLLLHHSDRRFFIRQAICPQSCIRGSGSLRCISECTWRQRDNANTRGSIGDDAEERGRRCAWTAAG